MRNRWWAWLAPLVFSLLGAYAVFKSIGSLRTLTMTQPHWVDLLAVAVLYPLFAAVRGLRFRQLLDRRQAWGEAVGIGWLYSAACSILPGGLGEISLPILYRGARDGPARATAALVLTRVQDLLSWLLILVLAGLAVRHLRADVLPLLLAAAALTLVGTVVVFSARARRLLVRLLGLLPSIRLRGFLASFDERLAAMAADLPSWAATAALRLLSIGAYYFALRAFDAQVTFGQAAVAGGIVALLLALPIQGLAGIGTVEVWWIIALRLFGVPWGVAAVAAIGVHLSHLLLAIAVGALSLRTAPRLVQTWEGSNV